MDKSKLEELNKKREALHVKYRLVAIEKITADDEFNRRLAEIGSEIREVDRDIRAEKMPYEEVEI